MAEPNAGVRFLRLDEMSPESKKKHEESIFVFRATNCVTHVSNILYTLGIHLVGFLMSNVVRGSLVTIFFGLGT